ncbi:MAG: hypothetical protein OXR66_08110 [Candidatus Woesearchaeota archaeon]|nr:hypothetical protein [Candidatus Woesearchaeota archaeon]
MNDTPLKEQATAIAHDVIERNEWRPFRDIGVTTEPDLPSSLEASIRLDTRNIHLVFAEDYRQRVAHMLATGNLSLSEREVIESVTAFAVTHEYGHHKWCPVKNEYFQDILRASFEEIQGKETRSERIKQLCLTVHNLFSDTILNTINSHRSIDPEQYRLGFDLHYYIEATHKKRMMGRRGKADKGFSLFNRTQKALSQTDPTVAKQMRKYERGFNLPALQRRLMTVFTGEKAITDDFLRRQIDQEALDYVLDRMANPEHWYNMAGMYTRIIYPYLRSTSSSGDNSFTRNSSQQSGQQGNKQQKPRDEGGAGNREKEQGDGNREKQPQNGEDFIERLLQRRRAPHSSPWLHSFYRLDSLYTERAGRVLFDIAAAEAEQPSYSTFLDTEEIDGTFNPKRIDWGATRIHSDEEGRRHVTLRQHTTPLHIDIPEETAPIQGIPDISYIFDSSISMEFNPFNNEGSGEYHIAALTFYSIQSTLQEMGVAPLISYNMINFSSETRESGWRSYGEIDLVKRTLFDYQGFGTTLDPNALQRLHTTRSDNFLSIMLSDGEFNAPENEHQVLEQVGRMTGCGVGFYFFQLGQQNTFSEGVRNAGGTVIPVASADAFMDGSIKLTKRLYGAEL